MDTPVSELTAKAAVTQRGLALADCHPVKSNPPQQT